MGNSIPLYCCPTYLAYPDPSHNEMWRDLIIHGPAHRGANRAAMPTDENDQDGHFFFNHPRGGGTPLPRRAQPLLLLFRSNPRNSNSN